jgi:hypothetical protein
MRNTQLSTSQVVNSAAASWSADALSTTAVVKREDIRPGIFYWAVNTTNLTTDPELLSSREAQDSDEDVALFMFEAKARKFQRKQLKAQRQH